MALAWISEVLCGLVVKERKSWPAYREFEPCTAEDPMCRGAMHVKSVEAQTSCGCGAEVRRRWYQLRCHPRHSTMVQTYEVHRQKPLSRAECNVNIYSLTDSQVPCR
ncbi:hypothetical protein TNCV_521881 [Trichonephila clavipes]|nr:hypothetical protein TNCV_521881 [Trichonephila clavipes]